jgi:hypothetical protein
MRDLIGKVLTRRFTEKRGKTVQVIEVPPSSLVVYCFIFTIISLVCLTALQIVHMIFLGAWNSEIFAAIAGLIGTITGILVGAKT